jgi:hypothetical protein
MSASGVFGRGVLFLVLNLTVVAGFVGDEDQANAAEPDVAIAYTSSQDGNSEVYSVPAVGGVSVNLTNNPASDSSPSWSPDASRIAFVSDRTGNSDIWVMDTAGGNLLNLTESAEAEHDPEWSPDGSRIAYAASPGDIDPSVFVFDIASGESTRLTVPSVPVEIEEWAHVGGDYDVAWSPDGTTIAFGRAFNGPTPTAKSSYIFTVAADGNGSETMLTKAGWVISGLDWSPDGASIVWSSVGQHFTSAQLKQWDIATGTKTDLDIAVHPPLFIDPAFNIDGSMLSFTATTGIYPDIETSGLYVWRFGSTEPPIMVDSGPGPGRESSWQPWYQPVGLVDTVAGLWTLRSESTQVRFFFGNPGDYPFVGDWNCDGTATPGLYRQSDGFVYLRNSNSQGVADISFYFGNPGDLPLAGDFNGDGCDTLSIYRPSEARFYIVNKLGENQGGLGAAEYSFLFGNPGDKPVVGDWDGDDIDEIGLHRETTGLFYYRNTLTTGTADGQFFFGDPGDRFVAGDWGVVDGVDTPAMFRPSNTTFYFRWTLTQGNADSQFTWAGAGMDWLPVAGDFTLD